MHGNATKTRTTALLDFTPDERGLCGFRLVLQLQLFVVVENSRKELNMSLKF